MQVTRRIRAQQGSVFRDRVAGLQRVDTGAPSRSRGSGRCAPAGPRGQKEAQIHLGEALFDGRGIGKDRALGLAWVLRGTSTAGAASLDDPTERRIVEMGERLAARMQAGDFSLLARATVLARSLPSKP
ncbi:MAG: hypothetical protein EOP91_09375 [Lysobacteraceae bacterium]|nr:MAG: hypothetical protein EOP91_09375 [Xanthomonadaceae bacterium]